MKWTEREIARTVHEHAFKNRHVVTVPNCRWPGHECDLLVVRNDLRLMDIEIKISRGDLKADAAKDKWFDVPDRWPWSQRQPRMPRAYPAKIWKHYYCVPAEIWTDELLAYIQPISGVLLIHDRGTFPFAKIRRQARPNRDAKPIDATDVIDIARLQSARMWDAWDEVDRHRRGTQSVIREAQAGAGG